MMKVLIGVLLSIFASAQAASLRGTSGSFLSNVDDNYGQCITGCNDLDTEERKICQDGCNDKYPHDAYGACNRRCARLRIAPGHCTCDPPEEPTKEPLEDSSGDEDGSTDRTADDKDYESCIVSCSEDYDTESSEFGQCRTECNEEYADDITPCQSRCWRLRLTRSGQVDCIIDCSADEEPTKEPLEDSSSGDEDNTDRTADGEDNYESCIVSCSEDYDTESSDFGQCRTECNEAYADDITPCQSRCWRLRLTRDGQVDCIVDCSADDEDTDASDGVSNRSADDEQEEDVSMDATPPPYEGDATPTPNEEDKPPVVNNPCKRRCDMLKIAPGRRMNACLDKCPTDDFYVRVS